jgi:predicted transcriptional regulator of viral defense system
MLAKDYIEALATRGRHHFTSGEAREAMGTSAAATKLALNRLGRRGLLASPARGFYVIVPPEYRSLGCLPAEQFIPTLMAAKGLPYYAGLLSAAQFYGAAHHRPQAFQVFLERNRRPLACGKVRVDFIARKRLRDVPLNKFNTPRGEIRVSSPEATAIDLAGYPQHAGGLDQVATVLAELVEAIDAALLPAAAATAPLPWAQRLGYLLELADAGNVTGPLRNYVQERARLYTALVPGVASEEAERNADWKVILNATVEAES